LLILCEPVWLRSSRVLGEPSGLRDRGGPAGVVGEQPLQLGGEGRVGLRGAELTLQLGQRGVERLGHELAAELVEVSGAVGQGAVGQGGDHGLLFRLGRAQAGPRPGTDYAEDS
jgi:hypothetical protein